MDSNVLDSMGYAYDYESIMHYGSKFFTKNEKDTIRIRHTGIGNVRIGQRKRLSDIDIAQINAMYNCNKIATPNSGKLTQLGWVIVEVYFYHCSSSQRSILTGGDRILLILPPPVIIFLLKEVGS